MDILYLNVYTTTNVKQYTIYNIYTRISNINMAQGDFKYCRICGIHSNTFTIKSM